MGTELIEGVVITPLKQIADERGMVMHMLRSDSPAFTQFGEVYFSQVNPGCIKAWKRHFEMTQRFAVPVGMICLVLYDTRPDSATKDCVQVINTGITQYQLITIPPLLWYGFQCVSEQSALIANCADQVHDINESESIASDSNVVPYHWEAAHVE